MWMIGSAYGTYREHRLRIHAAFFISYLIVALLEAAEGDIGTWRDVDRKRRDILAA